MHQIGRKGANQWPANCSWGGNDDRGGNDDGGWSQGPSVTGSGWNEPAAKDKSQDIGTWNPSDSSGTSWNQSSGNTNVIVDSSDKEAWPSIGNCDNCSDAGDETGSVKSGSVISSSSSHGPNHETNSGSCAMPSASSSWSATSVFGGVESNTWGINNPLSTSSANVNPVGWDSLNPHSSLSVSVNNKGHNMQVGTSISAGGDNSLTTMNSNASGYMSWGMGAPGQGNPKPQNSMQMQTSNGKNMHGAVVPSSGAQRVDTLGSGNPTGPVNNQSSWQGSNGSFGGLSGYAKTSEGGWNNSSAVMNNSGSSGKEKSGNNGSGDTGTAAWGNPEPPASGFSATWGANPPSQSRSQWDTSKSQGADNPNGAANSQGSGNKTDSLSWAEAAGKGLNISHSSGSELPVTGVVAARPTKEEEFIRCAIESHDGWGARPVRQDTGWETQESPKTKRKFSTDSGGNGNGGAANMWNNNNGTAIWEAVRANSGGGAGGNGNGAGGGNSGWNGASGGNQWEEDSNTWNDPSAKLNPNSIGTWGGGSDNAQSNMWGNKTETGCWDESGPTRQSVQSWDDPQARRDAASVNDGTNYWREPSTSSRSSSWNSTPSTPATPMTPMAPPMQQMPPREIQKPGATGSGWGDPNPGCKVDDGTSIWAANAQQQARASGWGDIQWNPAVGAKPKTPSTSNWEPGDNSSWNSRKAPPKFPIVNNHHPQMRSKLLQQLMDMGYKKEEAQNALISNNMNVESALADLMAINSANKKDHEVDVFQVNGSKPKLAGIVPDNAMLTDDISDAQSDNSPHVPNFSMQNTPFPNAQIPNQPFMTRPGPSLPSSSLNPNNSSITNHTLQHKLIQHKFQQQQQQTQSLSSMSSMSPTQGPMNRSQIPPNAQIIQQQVSPQMAQQQILQQLHMAVQSGLISDQLLHQKLPHNILILLQQLLQHQNILQQFVTKQQILQQNKAGLNPQQRQQLDQVTVMINNIKQQILQLQKQLSQAQQMLLKQTPSQGQAPQGGTPTPQPMPNPVDPTIPLQTDLSTLSMNPPTQPQSRLNQWKRPTPDKDGADSSLDINRVVGSKPLHPSQSIPNFGQFSDLSGLNITGDTTWSTQATTSAVNWPSTSAEGTTSQAETKDTDLSESHPPTPSTTTTAINLTDVIPEFIPGKPWQGFKNVEDDPHITPGSIKRSLSVNVVKPDHLNNLANVKSSPSLSGAESATTWSRDSQAMTAITSKQSWISSADTAPAISTSVTDVWSLPSAKNNLTANRPPPGLSGQSKWAPGVNRQHSWAGHSDSAFTPVNSQQWDSRTSIASTCLVLRNLTPQIDGSLLRTLCVQHGPLQKFHLDLGHSQAVVCYCTKEEASKAQKALNTCVLGNTTILAEFVPESDAIRFMEQSNPSQWSQNSQSSYSGHPGPAPMSQGQGHSRSRQTSQFYSRPDNSPWNPVSSSMSGGGNTMWGSIWGGGASTDEQISNPLHFGNILGGESM
ncbi:trinucleotide repeat-containing gene 6C protein-like isoform X2 [Gigantopelta aegis]|uniref:trinucleotide repeat-containing gene 6C protein-like isoform X2 n=1 Tax=Gigantopelta aegis TaxID=1735272 RepID=UPI001B88D96E|nr:trinucleotide repeat-containing gene 6C protein-like isoform X2 [Gigantopelta aegis]